MLISPAIKRAVLFIEKGNKEVIGAYVRLLPGSDTAKPALCAQTDRCGVVVFLEEQIPNTLIRGELLLKIARHAKTSISIESAAYGGVEIRTGAAKYSVGHEEVPDLGAYPGVPVIPNTTSWQLFDMAAVARVLHAAGKDGDRKNLMAINFLPGWVEAMDGKRIARAVYKAGVEHQGLLPAELFQKIPASESVGLTHYQGMAFLKVGDDEIRFARYLPMDFPDAQKVIPENHTGPIASIGVEILTRAVKQVVDVGATGSVELEFQSPNRLRVTAWQRTDAGMRLYESEFGLLENTGTGKVLLSGKALVEALQAVHTPSVRVGYGRAVDPLRIESAGYIECLWPMLA